MKPGDLITSAEYDISIYEQMYVESKTWSRKWCKTVPVKEIVLIVARVDDQIMLMTNSGCIGWSWTIFFKLVKENAC